MREINLYALPYRLNGIVECVMLFIFPFFVGLQSLRTKRGFLPAFVVISLYGYFNLGMSGSRNAAIFPVVVVICVNAFGTGRGSSLKRLLGIPFFMLILYTATSSLYFRLTLKESSEYSGYSVFTTMRESNRLAVRALKEGGTPTYGIVNLSNRVSTLMPMQWAINDTKIRGEPVLSVNEYLNSVIHTRKFGHAYAAGHYGFFMLLTGSHFAGFFLGSIVLGLFLSMAMRLDVISRRWGMGLRLTGLAFIINLLPFLMDGGYDSLSLYLHMVFNIVVARILTNAFVVPGMSTRTALGHTESLFKSRPRFGSHALAPGATYTHPAWLSSRSSLSKEHAPSDTILGSQPSTN